MHLSPRSNFFDVWVLRALWALSIALTTPAKAFATTDGHFETWNQVFAFYKINDHWSGFFEAQPRISLDEYSNNRLLIRPAVFYFLSPKVSVSIGYLWAPVFQPKRIYEDRLWQQLQIESTIGQNKVFYRFRLEQRWIENNSGTAHRARFWLRTFWHLGSESIQLATTDEVFFHLNDAGFSIQNGFDQNRLFVGPLFKVSNQLSIEAGYLNNYINRIGTSERMNHAIYSFVMFNL